MTNNLTWSVIQNRKLHCNTKGFGIDWTKFVSIGSRMPLFIYTSYLYKIIWTSVFNLIVTQDHGHIITAAHSILKVVGKCIDFSIHPKKSDGGKNRNLQYHIKYCDTMKIQEKSLFSPHNLWNVSQVVMCKIIVCQKQSDAKYTIDT